MQRESLYNSVYEQREVSRKTYQRVFISGYFNEEDIKRDNLNI